MPLADGDYLQVRGKVIATLLADTGPGGLCEAGDPPVKTIEARLRDEPGFYGRHEVPALVVTITGKREGLAPNFRNPVKVFELSFRIVCVGGDRTRELFRCQQIAHRLEELCREQTQTDRQFQDLPQVMDQTEGALICSLTRTSFSATARPEKSSGAYTAEGIVEAEVQIPCRLDWNG